MSVNYDKSEEHYLSALADESRRKVAETWLTKNTLDRWRHDRMLSLVRVLIKQNTSWLTIGDGRYGTDANFVISNGGSAHASDLSDALLRIGSEVGFINEFSRQNAEKLDFADDSFDYVLIKEALHHLPRPWMGLYEAFRVCRRAVIFVEPCESIEYMKTPLGSLINVAGSFKRLIKSVISGKRLDAAAPYHGFEEVGNYLYRFNKYEMEKFMMAMHRRIIATHEFNMIYEPGCEFVAMPPKSAQDARRVKRFKRQLKIANIKARYGLSPWNMLSTVLFKLEPDHRLIDEMRLSGWHVKTLPENPYLTQDQD